MTENVASDYLHDHKNDFGIPCHVTYQMKGYDFSIRPFNVLDKLEVIWPHHDRNVTSDDLHDHNNDFCVSHIM